MVSCLNLNENNNYLQTFPFKMIDGLQNDLKFVLDEMLSKGKIKPKISKFVSADELEYGLVTVSCSNIGSIICEPWIRRGPPTEASA
jgi:hypothetical protein